jgi:S-adenosylmethionine:diacylglycerol 3-amino-3-carboxypropyl transferase
MAAAAPMSLPMANPADAAAENVWQHGRFDARKGPPGVLFGRMYEDSAIEIGAFRAGGRVLCIASAGCTARALAARHEVVAVDINAAQLAYAARRLAGAPYLRGTAERVIDVGRSLAPLAGWLPQRLRTFLELADTAQQTAYWHRYLDTRRFRLAFDSLLSVAALRAVYAAPFLDFMPRNLGAVLRGRMERCFAVHPNRSNPYAWALLLGKPDECAMPVPAAARSNISLVHADVAAYLESEPAGSFDGFTLSNILDGAPPSYANRLADAVRRAARTEAMVVLRSFRQPVGTDRGDRAKADRSMLWGVVTVQPAADMR